MSETGKKVELAVREASRQLMERPVFKYLSELPGHKELNQRLAEANQSVAASETKKPD